MMQAEAKAPKFDAAMVGKNLGIVCAAPPKVAFTVMGSLGKVPIAHKAKVFVPRAASPSAKADSKRLR